MDPENWSRRRFVAAGASAFAVDSSLSGSQGGRLTAGEVVERIKKAVDIPWRTETVDKLVAGDAETPVKGIATTMMATLEVLERCAEKGRNLVITHETPFYLHQDKTEDLANDHTFQYKIEFIKKHGMAVFHSMTIGMLVTRTELRLEWHKRCGGRRMQIRRIREGFFSKK